ncbi:MAG: hypothetical protein PF693_09940 [Spirochaetia bacterium]|nr:hypothetical protein [Spirochaetia bacterium]
MKEKMRRDVRIRHKVGDYGKVDRVVRKSFVKEASHKVETSTWSDGFFSGIKRILSKIFGFKKKRPQPQHNGTGTRKLYCKRFGGAFGGSGNKRSNKGRPGVKLAKKLTIHI